MPKSTFLKLRPEKKKVFLTACYQEFARYSFAEASISRIVKTLGIAKGSVYQYFEDKNDLYTYLVVESTNRKYEILDFVLSRNFGSLKQWFLQACLAEVKFAEEFQDMYHLINKAMLEDKQSTNNRDYEYVHQAIKKLTPLPANEKSTSVFLLSSMKSAITAKYVHQLDSDLSKAEINLLCEQITSIVTNQS